MSLGLSYLEFVELPGCAVLILYIKFGMFLTLIYLSMLSALFSLSLSLWDFHDGVLQVGDSVHLPSFFYDCSSSQMLSIDLSSSTLTLLPLHICC